MLIHWPAAFRVRHTREVVRSLPAPVPDAGLVRSRRSQVKHGPPANLAARNGKSAADLSRPA